MLIPIGHDSMSTRRWPVVTFGLSLVNFVVFLGTHWVMEKQDSQLWVVREHILILSAQHPSRIPEPLLARLELTAQQGRRIAACVGEAQNRKRADRFTGHSRAKCHSTGRGWPSGLWVALQAL